LTYSRSPTALLTGELRRDHEGTIVTDVMPTRSQAAATGPASHPLPQWLVGADDSASRRASVAPTWHRRYLRTSVGLDLVLALLLTANVYFWPWRAGGASLDLAATLTLPLLWVAALAAGGAYVSWQVGTGPEEYRSIFKGAFYLTSFLAIGGFALQLPLSRWVLLLAAPQALVATLVSRKALRGRLTTQRLAGQALQPALVVGRGEPVAELVQEIKDNPELTGLKVVGLCATDIESVTDGGDVVADVPVFGGPDAALRAVDDLEVRTVVVLSSPELAGRTLRRLTWALAERGVELLVAPGLAEVAPPRLSVQPRAGLSLLHVRPPIMSGARWWVKRGTDAVLSALLIVVAFVPMVVIGLLVWRQDRGPVFYRQERVGERGERFHMFKFRTMVVDADARLDRGELEHVQQVNDKLFKDRHDPRVTPIGSFLRRYSIDELPQLINVVRGEMSLVGPRPPLAREVATYAPDEVQRLRVRPGMTGLWQISGRSDLNWEQSIRLDLWYVDNWTPLVDLQILVRTAKAVIAGRGAY
jgi:exopolysaccharide biosynthesis polyprenyl glycosylphosphotransferase